MNFPLDDDERFQLHTSANGGWDLIVDKKLVFYCRTPFEALKFMAEKLGHESPARGVVEVVEALEGIENAIRSAAEISASMIAAIEIGKALPLFAEPKTNDRKQAIKNLSLALAGCTEVELRVRPDRKKFVTKARAMLAPWFKAYGIEDEQN